MNNDVASLNDNQAKRVGKLACQRASADCSASVSRKRCRMQRTADEVGKLAGSNNEQFEFHIMKFNLCEAVVKLLLAMSLITSYKLSARDLTSAKKYDKIIQLKYFTYRGEKKNEMDFTQRAS